MDERRNRMDEKELMARWYNSGGVHTNDKSLVETLRILVKNGVSEFLLTHSGGYWLIGKVY
jgi:hypothetical protein